MEILLSENGDYLKTKICYENNKNYYLKTQICYENNKNYYF